MSVNRPDPFIANLRESSIEHLQKEAALAPDRFFSEIKKHIAYFSTDLSLFDKAISIIPLTKESLFEEAMQRGDLVTMELLLKAGFNANLPDAEGNTPLHKTTDKQMMELLLRYKANPNLPDATGNRPLYYVLDDVDKVELLIKYNANPNLLFLKERRQFAALKIQSHVGVNIREAVPELKNAIDALKEPDLEKIKALPACQEYLQSVNSQGRTPLFEAVVNGDFLRAKALLALGANPNTRDREGSTPLFHAIDEDQEKLVHLLLVKGANPNLKDKDGENPLSCAGSNEKIVKLLLLYGANPNSTTKDGELILTCCLLEDEKELVTLFTHYGADLEVAQEIANRKIAAQLVGVGGESTIKFKDGSNHTFSLEGLPRRIAFKMVSEEYARYMIEHQNDQNIAAIPQDKRDEMIEGGKNFIIAEEEELSDEILLKIEQKKPVLISAGPTTHGIIIAFIKGKMIIYNRGRGAWVKGGRTYAKVYQLKEGLSKEQIKKCMAHLTFEYESWDEFEEALEKEIEDKNLIFVENQEISRSPQKRGDCSVANPTASQMGLFVAYYGPELGVQNYKGFKGSLKHHGAQFYLDAHPLREKDPLYDPKFAAALIKQDQAYLSKH